MCGTALSLHMVKRTRKPHRCETCGRRIPKGTMAERWASVDAGSVATGYGCLDCAEFAKTKEGRSYAEYDGCLDGDVYADQEYAQWPILEPVTP